MKTWNNLNMLKRKEKTNNNYRRLFGFNKCDQVLIQRTPIYQRWDRLSIFKNDDGQGLTKPKLVKVYEIKLFIMMTFRVSYGNKNKNYSELVK